MSEDLSMADGAGPGSVIAEYRIESRIGDGRTGTVYRARDQRRDRLVALRVLAPQWTADMEFRLRFTAESRTAAAIVNPCILPVYEAAEAAGVLFSAMLLVSGPDAETIIRQEGILPPARTLGLLSPVASALDAAHKAGLVHRDVRPGNILTDKKPGQADRVYLAGFGLSTRAAPADLAGPGGEASDAPDSGPGAARYLSPEQARGDIIGGRADQYSLACVAVQFLTGRVPAGPGDLGDLAHESPVLPAAVVPVLTRATARTPPDRYPSCQDFTEALRGAFGLPPWQSRDQGGSARPAKPVPGVRAVRSRPAPAGAGRRSRKAALSIGTAIALVIAAAIAIPLALTQSPRPAPAPRPPAARQSSGLSRIATLVDPDGAGAADTVAFTPDGRSLIAATPFGDIENWDVATRDLTNTLPGPDNGAFLDSGGLSPDGRALAVRNEENGDIESWSTSAGKATGVIPIPGSTRTNGNVTAVAFSPDDRTLAVGEQSGDAYLCDTATGQIIGTFRAPHGNLGVDSMAFSPDGRTLATADGNGGIYLWSTATRALTATFTSSTAGPPSPDSDDALDAAAYSPDGRTLAVMDDSGTTYLIDTTTHQQVAVLAGSPDTTGTSGSEIVFSQNGRTIVTVDGGTRAWNAATDKSIADIPGTVVNAALSPDGRTLAAGNDNGEIALWHIPTP
jgi:serine/threonine-protein kinase